MAVKVILPAKYYLSHFFEFLDFVVEHYSFILEPIHLKFISDFKALSEEAQCTYIRMVNRKGKVFKRVDFAKYTEIKNYSSALDELQMKKFAHPVSNESKLDLLSFLTKPQLKKWLTSTGLIFPAALSRDDMMELGRKNLAPLDIERLDIFDEVISQGQIEQVEYLFFLYFGKIQKTLTLYTLRDLGVRESDTLKGKFKPRFNSAAMAQAEYFFAQQMQRDLSYEDIENISNLVQTIRTYQNLPHSTQNLKDQLLINIADFVIGRDAPLALSALRECLHPDAREKIARHLYKVDLKEDCKKVLEEISLSPRSDEELLFAEDFLSRKFHKKKVGYLTEILSKARLVLISDFYLKKPELGVIKLYEKQGYRAYFTENNIWNDLFGVLFWDELFQSNQAAIHNPFDRTPSDLVGPEFYENHQNNIEIILNLFKNEKALIKKILFTTAAHYGKLNGIFQWRTDLTQSLVDFVKNTTQASPVHVLRAMAKNYESNHSGFPDLMLEKEGIIHFVEVKAEGDSLRSNQLSKIRLLKEAGFEVEVLRVKWQADPNQTYVVVDVETTGGSAGFHRVTEIGAVKVQNGKVIDEFQTLINPGRSIPAFITQITGITNAMVAQAPTFADISERFL
ncbi:MAG: VRR-NUC domain-containing protein, partial [Bdellovibrionaceae bacterium]|nr:VRR-NUC domain-containing protein [Pseudobdellovibrionaceae bacterium]